MKKLSLIFAVGVMLALTACGEKSATTEQADSVVVDTTASAELDSTAIVADSTQSK